MNEPMDILDESGRWNARNVKYIRGRWDQVCDHLPLFKTDEFKAFTSGPANPYLRIVVRIQRNLLEQAIPVGVVSNSYSLAQHKDVGAMCLEGIRSAGITTDDLECEVGMTELGEWMNLRICFPERFSFIPSDGHPIRLRLECINSVDRSCRLTIFLSWLRLVCTNGMVVRETKQEVSDVHNENLNLERIPEVIRDSMKAVQLDRLRLTGWEDVAIDEPQIKQWADDPLATKWGKKAACRAFHICCSGKDVEYENPFEKGKPSEKRVKVVADVPGQPEKSKNAFDVSQALSWIASGRSNPEERIERQSEIPGLIESLVAN